ncbi:hypothetical protein JCM11641_002026 [Rhodosporidiobolus odoratus]
MGKRKSSKKPQSRVKLVLDKSFRCVFCAHQGSVTCKMDTKNHVGRLDCKDCNQTFTMDINHLSEPVDVYSAWIDACEAANPADAAPVPRVKKPAAPRASTSESRKRRNANDEEHDRGEEGSLSQDEDFLPDIRNPPAKKKKRAVTPEEEEEEEDAEGEDED